MANDLTLEARQAIVARMRASAALTARVPATNIYGEQPPAGPSWPFVRYGPSVTVPDRASGLDGCSISVSISNFARGASNDECVKTGKVVASEVEADDIVTDAGDLLNVYWTGSQTIRDTAEADGWHTINTFDVELASD